jgi:YHS domain-containing protein
VIVRQLIWILALFGMGWLLRRAFGRRPPMPRTAASSTRRRTDTEMVRDRVCNTFLPRERALTLDQGGQSHYFCSERCRDSFLGAGSAVG